MISGNRFIVSGNRFIVCKIRRCAGFTLMESMVVIGVMVILVGGAMVSYNRVVRKAEIRVGKQNRELIRNAIYEFYLDRGRYPESLEELTPKGDGRGYFFKVPVNPVTGNPDWVVLHPQGATVGVFDVSPVGSANQFDRGGAGR